jgi:hypothetical protein
LKKRTIACDEFMPGDENILSTEFFNSGAILALTVSVLVASMVFSKNFYAQIVAYSGYICQSQGKVQYVVEHPGKAFCRGGDRGRNERRTG